MLIKDMNELNRFINILPNLEKDEVYFLSLSARNKYLSDDERKEFELGRTEMFSREVARDKEGIYKAINKMEISLQYRKTRNGKDIPEKCLIYYMNINPSSMIKAYINFQNDINKEMEQIMMAFKNGNQPNYERMVRLPQQLNRCIQSSSSRKVFVDIDVDLVDVKDGNDFVSYIQGFVDYSKDIHFILTKSGFHILAERQMVKDFRLYDVVKTLKVNNKIKEIEFNKNAMVPIPGTLQANTIVRMI